MKKYHLYLWIIALVGLMTSCSQDETDALQTTTESNRVTLTASLPADFAQPQPQSRALPTPPSSARLRCILEVWDENLTTCKVRKEVVVESNSDATQIDFAFTLEATGNYKALLWADYIFSSVKQSSQTIAGITGDFYGDNYYYKISNADGLKAVTVKNWSNLGGSIVNRDAFSACKPFTKEATALKDLSATLTRPYAKLTLAEKDATNFGFCKSLTVNITSPNTLNVGSDEVTGTKTENLLSVANNDYGSDITISGKTCKLLLCTYILVPKNGSTMGEIKLAFTAQEESGKTLKDITIPAGIPVKRNFRTNAAGNLIVAEDAPSSTVNMSVDINNDWNSTDEEHDIDANQNK